MLPKRKLHGFVEVQLVPAVRVVAFVFTTVKTPATLPPEPQGAPLATCWPLLLMFTQSPSVCVPVVVAYSPVLCVAMLPRPILERACVGLTISERLFAGKRPPPPDPAGGGKTDCAISTSESKPNKKIFMVFPTRRDYFFVSTLLDSTGFGSGT